MDVTDNNPLAGIGPDGAMANAGALESQLVALEDRLRELPSEAPVEEAAAINLEMGRTLLGLGRNEEAWNVARPAFDVFLRTRDWQRAVEVCDVLFLSGQADSLSALGQGIWLGVTFPIDPDLTLNMLHHVIEETPDDSDGAAVAAATAAYVADLRAPEDQHENLMFFANQMLGSVARRHGDVQSQEQFDFWMERLELNDPQKFLVRLRNVVDVLVQDDWWFDREQLQQTLPVN
jgi:hypothetical protein